MLVNSAATPSAMGFRNCSTGRAPGTRNLALDPAWRTFLLRLHRRDGVGLALILWIKDDKAALGFTGTDPQLTPSLNAPKGSDALPHAAARRRVYTCSTRSTRSSCSTPGLTTGASPSPSFGRYGAPIAPRHRPEMPWPKSRGTSRQCGEGPIAGREFGVTVGSRARRGAPPSEAMPAYAWRTSAGRGCDEIGRGARAANSTRLVIGMPSSAATTQFAHTAAEARFGVRQHHMRGATFGDRLAEDRWGTRL